MNRFNNENISNGEEAIKEKLEELKYQITQLNLDLPCFKQCSRLSHLLQKMYEIREGLNQLEQGLLQNHLRCCISSSIKVPEEVIIAVSNLSTKRYGAIIVIEREKNLDTLLQGGVTVDAAMSSAILENIFFPGSPLHDGAVLIRNAHIKKANCVLPLAPHTSELDALGLATRHRAALGLSQVSDALVIVISEEKGWISLTFQGQFYPNVGTFAFLEKLGHDEA